MKKIKGRFGSILCLKNLFDEEKNSFTNFSLRYPPKKLPKIAPRETKPAIQEFSSSVDGLPRGLSAVIGSVSNIGKTGLVHASAVPQATIAKLAAINHIFFARLND